MRTPVKWILPALVAVLLVACVLGPQDLQAFRLFFTLNQDLVAGTDTEVYSVVYPAEAKTRKQFLQILGRLDPAPGDGLPNRIEVEVALTDLATENVYFRHRQTVTVAPDGSFAGVKRFKRDIRANSLQTILVRPVGADVSSGADVSVCVELAKKASNLSPEGSCTLGGGGGGGGGGAAVTVRVVENAFDPKRVQIQSGQTVRWVLNGQMFNHTVSEMNGAFDSGFSLDVVGAVFERTFGAADNNRTFQYSCRTHQACCAMQGSVQVGNGPEPPPDY